MRTEFTKKTMREAYERSEGLCEGILADGTRCNANLAHKPHHYDHIIPDGIGGKNDLQNCQVLCKPCHAIKTGKIDIPMIARSKRVRDKHIGIKKPRTITRWRKFNGDVVIAARQRS